MNRPTYTIITLTQHWRIIDGRTYRDVIARRPDGTVGLVAWPDTEAAG